MRAHRSPQVDARRPESTNADHSYRLAVVGRVIVTALGAAQVAEADYRADQARADLVKATQSDDPCLGAGALVRGPKECPVKDDAKLVPTADLAKSDKSDAYPDNCWTNSPFVDRTTCTYGNGPKKVALVGNSHAGHWLPALQVLAKKNGWTITTYLLSRCAASDGPHATVSKADAKGCDEYGQWVKKETSGDRYDLVITSERQSVPISGESLDTSKPKAMGGYTSYLKGRASAGANILVIKDPTFPVITVPDCLAEHEHDHS